MIKIWNRITTLNFQNLSVLARSLLFSTLRLWHTLKFMVFTFVKHVISMDVILFCRFLVYLICHVMQQSNIPADFNVLCFLTKNGEFTPLSSLVVASFSMHCKFSDALKEADRRTAPLIKALEMCHSVPWKCLVTIIHSGAYVKHLHRRYLINYENHELPF